MNLIVLTPITPLLAVLLLLAVHFRRALFAFFRRDVDQLAALLLRGQKLAPALGLLEPALLLLRAAARFGSVLHIREDEYRQEVSDEAAADRETWVVVHLFKDTKTGCVLVNRCLDELALLDRTQCND